jgi:hypothetical protein
MAQASTIPAYGGGRRHGTGGRTSYRLTCTAISRQRSFAKAPPEAIKQCLTSLSVVGGDQAALVDHVLVSSPTR